MKCKISTYGCPYRACLSDDCQRVEVEKNGAKWGAMCEKQKTMITPKQKRRLYRLHYQLHKRGNKVNARQRFVTKRAKEVSPIEQKYIAELIAMQYCVCDDMFENNKVKYKLSDFRNDGSIKPTLQDIKNWI